MNHTEILVKEGHSLMSKQDFGFVLNRGIEHIEVLFVTTGG
jgi:hypothetical protein